jgi:hypothetical protein
MFIPPVFGILFNRDNKLIAETAGMFLSSVSAIFRQMLWDTHRLHHLGRGKAARAKFVHALPDSRSVPYISQEFLFFLAPP